MDIILHISSTLLGQLQQPTLAFLLGGMALAATGSRFEIPAPIYKMIVVLLLLKVGMNAGIALRSVDPVELLLPALAAALIGIVIVLIGSQTLMLNRNVSHSDAYATAGLFGAVSASTLAAAMSMLEGQGVFYEGYIGVLYPFMDLAALLCAILLAKMATAPVINSNGTATMGGAGFDGGLAKEILLDTLRSPAISALFLGLALGAFARPDSVYAGFYEPMFRGLLSLLMLIMGMEAWSRLSEMRKVAHSYILYGITAPLLHGGIGLAAGYGLHMTMGFSAGGMVLLAVMAASSSDISGPPTLKASLPEANPSAYVGTSTGLGTPIAILSIPAFIAIAQWLTGS